MKIRGWKIAGIVTVMAIFFFFTACQDQVLTEVNDLAKSSTVALDVPADVQKKYDELREASPEKQFLLVEVDQKGQAKVESLKEKMDQLPPERIASVNVLKSNGSKEGEDRSFIIVEYNDAVKSIQETSKEGDVYTMVEHSAMPEGGMNTLYEYLGSALKYPAEAQEKGLQGKVFISFVVEADGTLSNLTVEKGIDPDMDAEALRVMKGSPKWAPGKQNGEVIRQRLVLPIQFSLPDKTGVGKVGTLFFYTPFNPFKLDKDGSVKEDEKC